MKITRIMLLPRAGELQVSLPSFMFLLVIVVINAILQPNFFTPYFLWSNLANILPLIFASLAALMIIINGEIDLSIGASISLINVITVTLLDHPKVGDAAAIVIGLFIGIFIGIFNGLIVAYLRIGSLLATFATSSIWAGIALWILPEPGGIVPSWLYRGYKGNIGGIPMPVVLLALAVAIWMIFRRHSLGQYSYAVGGAPKEAFANGIAVSMVKFGAFTFAGLLTGMAGLSLTCVIASGDPTIGNMYTLKSIAAAVIGGASLYGGVGAGGGAIAGAVALELLNNVVFFLGVSSFYQEFIYGLIIIAALVIMSFLRYKYHGNAE